MSRMMLHGLGDCTPEHNCGCLEPPRHRTTVAALTTEHRAVVREIAALTADNTPGPVVPPKRLRELLDREQELSELLAETRRDRAEDARRDNLDDARQVRAGMEAWLS